MKLSGVLKNSSSKRCSSKTVVYYVVIQKCSNDDIETPPLTTRDYTFWSETRYLIWGCSLPMNELSKGPMDPAYGKGHD